jgi:hypothetical protein
MTAMTDTAAPFTAARVQGRYRVLDEAGQIVVTLNSKAKAEARAAELNAEHAEAALSAQIEADVAMEQAMDAECPQEDAADLSDLQAEWDAHPEYAEAMTPAVETTETVEQYGPDAVIVTREFDAAPAAEERQEEPAGDAGTSDTPAAPAEPEKPAKTVKPAKTTKPKADQPAPHAFTTVGTTIKNHCADCGRSWAAAAHRKFREAQTEVAPEVATPADAKRSEVTASVDGGRKVRISRRVWTFIEGTQAWADRNHPERQDAEGQATTALFQRIAAAPERTDGSCTVTMTDDERAVLDDYVTAWVLGAADNAGPGDTDALADLNVLRALHRALTA